MGSIAYRLKYSVKSISVLRTWAYYLSVCVDGNIKWDIPQGAWAAESRGNWEKNRMRILEGWVLWKFAGTFHPRIPNSWEVQSASIWVWYQLVTNNSHPFWFKIKFSNFQWFLEISSDCQLIVTTVSSQPTTNNGEAPTDSSWVLATG